MSADDGRLQITRVPPLPRLLAGWDALVPELDPIIAELPEAQRLRVLGLVLQVGVAVEELR